MIVIAPRGPSLVRRGDVMRRAGGDGGFRQPNRLGLAAYSPRLMERYPSSTLMCDWFATRPVVLIPMGHDGPGIVRAAGDRRPAAALGPPVSNLAAVRQDLLVHDDCMIQIAARVIEFDEAIDERLVRRILHDSWGNDVSDLVQVPSQRLVEPDGDVGRGFLPADRVWESLE